MSELSRTFQRVALKRVVSLRRSSVMMDHVAGPYVGLENIESWTGRFVGKTIDESDLARPQGSVVPYNTFEPDDVLFGKLRPYLAKAWIAKFGGCSTTELLVMQPVDVERRFLRYVLTSRDFVDAVDAAAAGSRMPRAEWSQVGGLPIPLPARRLQCAIADYLDQETERIDTLIEAKRKLVGLMAERRRTLITGAVTKGLNRHGYLKDTGVSWLIRSPAHWDIWKVGHLAAVGNGATPSRNDERYWSGGAIPWLNSGVVNQDEVISSEEHVTEVALQECHLPLLEPGTVLVAIIGQGKTRGRATVLTTKATVNQNVAFVRPTREYLNPWFLRWWLFAAYEHLRSLSDDARGPKGVLSCEDLANLRIALPPRVEQDAIVEHIRREADKIGSARVLVQRSISLLEERRQALVAGAVGGKVDVAGAVCS